MIRRLVILGALAGAGWYAYRRVVVGNATGPVTADGPAAPGDRPAAAGDITGRVTQSMSQAATAARQAATAAANKVRAAAPLGGGGATDRAQPESQLDGESMETRAAAIGALPTP